MRHYSLNLAITDPLCIRSSLSRLPSLNCLFDAPSRYFILNTLVTSDILLISILQLGQQIETHLLFGITKHLTFERPTYHSSLSSSFIHDV